MVTNPKIYNKFGLQNASPYDLLQEKLIIKITIWSFDHQDIRYYWSRHYEGISGSNPL